MKYFIHVFLSSLYVWDARVIVQMMIEERESSLEIHSRFIHTTETIMDIRDLMSVVDVYPLVYFDKQLHCPLFSWFHLILSLNPAVAMSHQTDVGQMFNISWKTQCWLIDIRTFHSWFLLKNICTVM